MKTPSYIVKHAFLMFLCIILSTRLLQAQVSLTTSGVPYTQNFNTYTSAASAPQGWTYTGSFLGQIGGSNCSNTQGGIYSFGSAGNYAFGILRSNSASSNTLSVTFQNNTGSVVTSLTIGWDYRQYGGCNSSGLNATGTGALAGNPTVNAADWTGTPGAPTGATTTVPAFTLSGLSIANGSTFGITWSLVDNGGSDNGSAIDNFTITATSAAPLGTFSATAIPGFGNVCVNTVSTEQSFNLSGTGLNGTNATIGPLPGYQFSTAAGGPFANTLVIPAFSGAGIPVYVTFNPVNASTINGNIPVTGAGGSPYAIPVSGTGIAAVTPSIAVSSDAPLNTICAGTNVIFSATVSNEGAAPVYQWKKNGINVGSNASSYADNALLNGDIITCELTSNATCVIPAVVTAADITMIVNNVLIPTISIVSDAPSNTICDGTNVTFSATVSNEGITPVYQWKKNGINVGSNASSYSDNALASGDIITCELTSNAICAAPAVVTANDITMIVNTVLVPTIAIVSDAPSNTICDGTGVTFTATVTNEGAAPVYQWKKNGINVGSNAATYSDNALATGDIVTCELTSNAVCAAPALVIANDITMIVNTNLIPFISVVSDAPANTICAGTTVTFTATVTNEGTAPVYQWKKNGMNVGTNAATYVDNALLDGDIITCELTSNAVCAVPAVVTGNDITMLVNAVVTPAISIASDAPSNTACSGTVVTFTATATNEGTVPVYQWKKNGINVGANVPQYTDNALVNGDVITCELTGNATCATVATVTSNPLQMNVGTSITAFISIVSNAMNNDICAGTDVTFTANISNGGTVPAYQWKKNGGNVGTNTGTYSDNSFANGDIITCELTSNETCVATPVVLSNAITMNVVPVLAPSLTIIANPSGTIAAGTNVVYTASPVNGGPNPVFQWKKNGMNVGTNSATYSDNALTSDDVVTCVMESDAPCADPGEAASNPISITIVGVGLESEAGSGLNVYPNPSAGKFYVSATANDAASMVASVINIQGQVVYSRQFAPGQQWQEEFDLSGLPSGMYTLCVENDGNRQFKRLVIKK